VLWIVLEFDYVKVTVRGAHQLRLGPAPQPPHMLDSLHRHQDDILA
jgi:hypothetical protein